ncbi:response regulator transcription factor [Aeoliella mucimassa]|uniref:Response regulator FixJ n=1 Tax=Aeoliella mucimassa TaxID=2527972 RepID=A0A518AMI4_9BACT|nr:LuxR C-terminal-related transcriptional regulator [Aeoliella mucimassa]QDU55928.1 response regulator FixJ [Aeoliella mucimassa]
MSHDLTPRECEVVRLISLGCSDLDAGKVLGLSPSTINTHRTNAMQKLGVRKVALLTRLAIKHRITKMTDTLTPSEKRKCKRKKDGWS